ncbi:enoyl-CoA hydratase/isomerase family protein [Pyrenochaeta sp. MPI-SDFR-AT-0127]|nr:enoyl-CoA hydratase/isomerase family protein [Pyrenochaeta sp. MPI-SDFR-AT-0127]
MAFSLLRSSVISLLLCTATGLELPTYPGLRTDQSKMGVLEIGFNSTTSEINAWGQEFVSGLTDIVSRLQNNTEIKVLLFKSDKPQYFIPHLDLLINPPDPTIVPRTVDLIYNITKLPQVSIGAVNGIARGGGNEFLTALDMRFATKPHARFGQPEVASGIIPGAGGNQFLPGLIGRGRAMEYILSGKDVEAEDAERMGWINKAFDSERQMDAYIDELISRLVLYPVYAFGLAKESINIRTRPQLSEIQGDTDRYLRAAANPIAIGVFPRTLEVLNNQSAGNPELFLGEYLPLLWE